MIVLSISVMQAQEKEPVRMGVVDDDSAIASLTESLEAARPSLPPNYKLSPIQVQLRTPEIVGGHTSSPVLHVYAVSTRPHMYNCTGKGREHLAVSSGLLLCVGFFVC